ncbi:MAG TPA: Ig-like domain-containing protein, partial [Thermoanaerobaculia bacterium]|nr:Ig-like domain-containing protein [Thermoanaerobaculia bacterium]
QLLAPLGSAAVAINGVAVTVDAAGAFRKNDVAVTSGDNAITATVRPANGTASEVTVHVTGDFQPPVVRLLAGSDELSDGAHFATAPSIVLEVTDDNPGLGTTFTVDGNIVNGTTVANLAGGGHTLTVVATDRAGNQTRLDRTLAIGAGGGAGSCALSAIDPPNGTAVSGASIRITGRIGGATAVLVNSNAAQLAGGSFAADVALQPGSNDISIVCDSGEATHLTLFRYDNAAIAITSPHDDDVIAAGSVTVSGTVAPGVISGDVNGKPFTAANGTFSVPRVELGSGINILTAHAKSSSSRAAVATVRVKHFGAPSIAITSPLAGTQTGAASIDISGTFANVDPSTITISGATATTTPLGDTAGTFTFAAVSLAAGANTIAVTARGRDGATVTSTVDVQRLAGAPSLAIESPRDNASLSSATAQLAVSGTVTPVTGTQLQVNGTVATIDAAGHFTVTLDLTGAAAGVLPIVARATGGDGKTATDTIVVTRFAAPLSVRRPFPAQNAVDVDPGAAVVLLFTNAVDPSTVPNAIHLADAAGAAVPVRTFIDRDAVTLAPLAPLTAGLTYTATVATSLQDLAGGALAAPYSLPFSVASTAPLAMPDVDPIAGG